MALATSGTITSTFLPLARGTDFTTASKPRDRAWPSQRPRARWNVVLAFLATFVEALLTLAFLRALWRGLKRLGGLAMRRRAVAT